MANHGYAEIAAMLDISVSTVRTHVSNARKQLRPVMLGD
jgi:DNA-directed RNA polymerase specialized sigma24 family protein